MIKIDENASEAELDEAFVGTSQGQVQVDPDSMILEEIVIEDLQVDGICGVY